MRPELAPNLPSEAGAPPADVVALLSSHARAEELRTPPPHLERGGVDVDDVAREVLVEDPPATDAEITEAVLKLRDAHNRSPGVIRPLASQIPRSLFLAVVERSRRTTTQGAFAIRPDCSSGGWRASSKSANSAHLPPLPAPLQRVSATEVIASASD